MSELMETDGTICSGCTPMFHGGRRAAAAAREIWLLLRKNL
jgi:hypothetical protein